MRMGPTVMGVPHRGHDHVASGVATVSGDGAGRRRLGEQRAGERQARGPTATGEIAKLPDADKPARQDMLDEASEKLHRRHGHRAPAGLLAVVLPAKRDALAVEGEQAVIADRDAMRVAPEIAQHRRRAAKGGLGVDDPVGVEERVDEGAATARDRAATRWRPRDRVRRGCRRGARPPQTCRETPD